MQIRKINVLDRIEADAFIHFPIKLYKKSAAWIPPLLDEARSKISNHPYFEHSQAAFYIVETAPPPEGEVLGRIGVFDNRRLNEFARTNTAYFGSFETIDNEEVSSLLFDAASNWARNRGLNGLRGPLGLTPYDSTGLLVEGFENQPVYNIPFNFPYYEKHLIHNGLSKDQDYFSGYLDISGLNSEKFYNLTERVMRRHYLWVKSVFSKPEMNDLLPQIMKVYIEINQSSDVFYNPTDNEIRYWIDSLLAFGSPGLTKILMDRNQVVGFLMGYLDISKALRKTQGRLLPTGWYTVLRETKQTPRIILHQLGVLPSHRNLGGDLLLYHEMQKTILAEDYEHIEITQVSEKTLVDHPSIHKLGIHWYKKHRTFMKNLLPL